MLIGDQSDQKCTIHTMKRLPSERTTLCVYVCIRCQGLSSHCRRTTYSYAKKKKANWLAVDVRRMTIEHRGRAEPQHEDHVIKNHVFLCLCVREDWGKKQRQRQGARLPDYRQLGASREAVCCAMRCKTYTHMPYQYSVGSRSRGSTLLTRRRQKRVLCSLNALLLQQ